MPEISKGSKLEIRPITYHQACQFIIQYHRHHGPPQGCKFCIGAFVKEKMVACAVCGRPVARTLDNGQIEVKARKTGSIRMLPADDFVDGIRAILEELKKS